MAGDAKRKAVIYARFSPRPDARETKSNATQLAECKRYCEAKGYELAGEFCDRAAEGDDPDRPGLWDAVMAVPRGGVLVVSEMHRLARCPIIEDKVVQLLRKQKASIEPVDGKPIPADESPQDEAMRVILSVIARLNKKANAALTKARMRAMQKAGTKVGGVPYGFALDPDSRPTASGLPSGLIPVEDEQRVIRRMQALARARKAAWTIASTLNAEDLRKRNGSLWDAKSVKRILAREGLGVQTASV
jgi:site-specific DNA recombinase